LLTLQTRSGKWSITNQNSFSAYLGQVVGAWANLTDVALQDLFSGSSTTLPHLDTLIQNGHFIDGVPNTGAFPPDEETLTVSITEAFWTYAIPSLWTVAGYAPVVIDSGYTCGTTNPLSEYMTTGDQAATFSCYTNPSTGVNELYYLVWPITKANQGQSCPGGVDDGECAESFAQLPGTGSLGSSGSSWSAVTLDKLVKG
jgi:hypothetical protein